MEILVCVYVFCKNADFRRNVPEKSHSDVIKVRINGKSYIKLWRKRHKVKTRSREDTKDKRLWLFG